MLMFFRPENPSFKSSEYFDISYYQEIQMSFWSGTKKIISATGSAFNDERGCYLQQFT